MKKFLGFVLMAAFVGCGDDSKSGGVANVFEPTNVITKNTDEYFTHSFKCISSPKTATNSQLDARLAKGQVFSTVYLEKNYENPLQTTQRDQTTIESISFEENSYTFIMRVNFQGNSGWLRGRRDFVFGEGYGGSQTTLFDSSPNYKPLLEKIESDDEEGEVYWSCYVDEGSSAIETKKVEIGMYTLSSGKKVNATRAERVVKGNLTCTKYSRKPYKKGEVPEFPETLEERNLGQGEMVEVRMYSKDIPNNDGCADAGMDLEYSRVISEANGKLVDSDIERLENAVY